MAMNETIDRENPWQSFSDLNLGYVDEQYDKYLEDPQSVDPTLQDLFNKWGRPKEPHAAETVSTVQNEAMPYDIEQVVAAVRLADRIRTYGHLLAHIDPLGTHHEVETHLLDLAAFNLSPKKLKAIPSQVIWPEAPAGIDNALDVIQHLRTLYSQSLAYEFSHVHNIDEKRWLNQKIEQEGLQERLSNEEKIDLLKQLTKVEAFEHFLHKTFVGQKRFSIEGVDALVPMLDKLIQYGVKDGAKNVIIGMAHRGRLSVLAHILGKPYEKILAEFVHSPNKDLVPSEGSKGINYGWTGDVKYHLGADREIEEGKNYLLQYTGEEGLAKADRHVQAKLTMANNPSHLEVVDPVIEGYARAAQDDRTISGYSKQNVEKAFSIMIHGDAAFPGEGVVAETFNLSQLNGFSTGGTIHIIANNQIGFTTDQADDRSTKYASDLAKGYEVPIVHVNADDPEACLSAIYLAYQYRKTFHKDFLIDLCGYRRYGHNESDDPQATQPLLYKKINSHPMVSELYQQKLEAEKVASKEDVETYKNHVNEKLQAIYDKVKETKVDEIIEPDFPKTLAEPLSKFKTAVPADTLKALNQELLDWPSDFHPYPKLGRILRRREKALETGKIDWGHAEALAFASILKDGTPIRFTGQDVERGTFAHRHAVLHDTETGRTYSPFHTLKDVKASFDIHNSPLSETAVIGFEYGYNVFAPETLVLWEAQFGDFANVGQVIFDQFVSAGRAKWGQKSGFVMTLPHGYEGMGPEHSSGRVERYLQLAAENNWTVANLSTPAQYFHILRRQAAILGKDVVRPLVIMSPKSLLRHPKATSSLSDLSDGHFQSVVEQPGLGGKPSKVERLVLCSGKVSVDLAVAIEAETANLDWLHVLRVEELYPFPKDDLKAIFDRYSHLKEIVWLQEEPKNMGPWGYIESRVREIAPEKVDFRYIGRPYRSSPASGEPDMHKKEQKRIITETLQKS